MLIAFATILSVSFKLVILLITQIRMHSFAADRFDEVLKHCDILDSAKHKW